MKIVLFFLRVTLTFGFTVDFKVIPHMSEVTWHSPLPWKSWVCRLIEFPREFFPVVLNVCSIFGILVVWLVHQSRYRALDFIPSCLFPVHQINTILFVHFLTLRDAKWGRWCCTRNDVKHVKYSKYQGTVGLSRFSFFLINL